MPIHLLEQIKVKLLQYLCVGGAGIQGYEEHGREYIEIHTMPYHASRQLVTFIAMLINVIVNCQMSLSINVPETFTLLLSNLAIKLPARKLEMFPWG